MWLKEVYPQDESSKGEKLGEVAVVPGEECIGPGAWNCSKSLIMKTPLWGGRQGQEGDDCLVRQEANKRQPAVLNKVKAVHMEHLCVFRQTHGCYYVVLLWMTFILIVSFSPWNSSPDHIKLYLVTSELQEMPCDTSIRFAHPFQHFHLSSVSWPRRQDLVYWLITQGRMNDKKPFSYGVNLRHSQSLSITSWWSSTCSLLAEAYALSHDNNRVIPSICTGLYMYQMLSHTISHMILAPHWCEFWHEFVQSHHN